MKKYHCCVPGCKTYGTKNCFLNIPFESKWRDQWLAVIPRKDWVVDSSTVACIRHFESSQTVTPFMPTKQESHHENNEVTNKYENVKAVPQFFPESNPAKNNARNYIPVEMFEIYCRDCKGPDVFADIEDDDKDYLINYWYFKLMYPRRFATFLEGVWKAFSTDEYTVFYTIDFAEIPRVISTIKIDNNLSATVILDGRCVDPCDLTWVLPITTNKVNRWSQLQIMLAMFGK